MSTLAILCALTRLGGYTRLPDRVGASLKCISFASDGGRSPLAALAAAVLLEVIANSLLSQKLVYNLKSYV